ncbi:phosphatidylserine decarboxylase family protein [Verrucomicrobia bacterium LW23]|nr:phosphatidylserine decarboxylase family protein [Verrucomicrobia bacterium LW23]
MPPSAARECLLFLIPLAVVSQLLGAGFYFGGSNLCLAGFFVTLVLMAAVAAFFRDPDRQVPEDEQLVVAAADGLIVGIEDMTESPFGPGEWKRIAIYLSVFDVHVNRMPVSGKVLDTFYKPGKFHDVRDPRCSLANEYLAWLIECPAATGGKVVVRQIAGLVARRIVAFSSKGDELERGHRFGMIRFGSRTEIYLPPDVEVLVTMGQRVWGAATPIARLPHK